jgi:hypothetical protein
MQNDHCPVPDVLAIEVHAMIFIDGLPADNYNKPTHAIIKCLTLRRLMQVSRRNAYY